MSKHWIAVVVYVAAACGNNNTNLTNGDGGSGGGGGDGNVSPSCVQLEATCGSDFDCCSGRCHDGECLPGGSCLAPGLACTDGATNTCCSGRCEPVEGQAGVTQCTDLCRADGVACAKATDCCNLDCNSGTCGGSECGVESDPCSNDASCCSNICTGGQCQLDPANTTCRGVGETCNSGPQSGCCSMVCDNTVNPPRCDFGSDTCAAQNGTCAVDGDCCFGACDPGTHTCQTACTGTGLTCTNNAECCSSICLGGSCAAPPNCSAIGSACATGDTCCSGICAGGFCGQLL